MSEKYAMGQSANGGSGPNQSLTRADVTKLDADLHRALYILEALYRELFGRNKMWSDNSSIGIGGCLIAAGQAEAFLREHGKLEDEPPGGFYNAVKDLGGIERQTE